MRHLLVLLFLSFFSCVSIAQTVEVSLLIDRSGSGGCTVAGVDPIAGVDARVTASVDSASAQVDALTLENCEGAAFGAPQTLDGGYPVGLNNGEGGSDVVELSVDAAELGGGSAQFAFTALADDGSSVDQASGGFAGITVPVPLAPWALLLLALALMLIALWALSRHRGPTVLLLGLVAVSAWAAHFMLDGEISDWTGVTPISDPAGDPTAGGNRTDILAVFSAEEDGRLWFRVDLADIENASPSAANDAFTTDEDTLLTGENVLADNGSGADSDPDGDALTVTGFDATSVEGAAVTIAANGDLDYDPTAASTLQALAVGESQDDTFTYTIEDPDGSSDTATVTVSVDGVNDAPTASDDAFTTDKNTPITTTSVLVNDTDPDTSDTLSIDSIDTTATAGVVTDNGDGTFDYDPDGQFDGLGDGDSDTDTFTYTLTDGNGGTDTATVTITVNGANTAPVATDDAFATDEDSALTTGDVLANDSDAEGDTLSVDSFDTTGTQGLVTNNGDGTFGYDPNGQFESLADGDSDIDTFVYTVTDGNGGTDTATVTITVNGVNDAPEADDSATTTDEDTPVTITLTGSDADGDALTFGIASGPADGSLGAITQLTPTSAEVTYTPDPDFNGPDSFTFTVNDGNVDSPAATVSISVDAVNDAPSFAASNPPAVNEDAGAQTVNSWAVFDPGPNEGGQSVVGYTVSNVTNSALFSAGPGVDTSGNLSYTPAPDAFGTSDFDVTVQDDGGTANGGTDTSSVQTFTITVNAVDDPPVAVDDSATITEDDPATVIDVLANDTDVDGGPISITGVTQPANGTVVNNTTDVSYEPDPDYCNDGSPTDDFTYSLNGGSTATVAVTVTCVNDPPVVLGETFDVAAGNFEPAIGNTTLQFANTNTVTEPHVFEAGDALDNDNDVEGDPLSITEVDGDAAAVGMAKSLPSGAVVTMAANGEFTYSPPLGFEGNDSFTYTVFDGTDGSVATVNIEIAGMVWYLDNDIDGSGDDGRSASPFDSIAQFEAVNGGGGAADPEAGDIIFIHAGAGSYDAGGGDLDGIDLLDGQKLYGEGAGLTVGATTLIPAGTRPMIDNTNTGGDAVTVLADGADRTDIEIRGLAIAGDNNAIDVTSANTFGVGVTIFGNTFVGSSAEGIDLNPGASGAFAATVGNNMFSTSSAVGNAIDLTTAATAGDVEIAIDGNTDITSSGAGGIVLDNSAGGGALFVTSFSGNSIHGNTAGDGIRIISATFDANPADVDFTGDEVAAGNMSVGSSTNPVGGSALVLTNVAGDLAFGTLDLYTDGSGAAGLAATGTGTLDAAAGTGFELTNTGGTIDSANGPGVDLDPLTAGLTLGSVSSANSPTTGISLTDVAGSFTASAGSITGSAGNALHFTTTLSSPLDINYGGTVTNSAGYLINVDGLAAGSDLLFDGTSLSDNGGTGIAVNDFDGVLTVSAASTTIANSLATGFAASGDTDGTVNLDDVTITDPAGTAVQITDGTDRIGAMFDFDNVDVSQATTGARLVDIQGLSGGSVDFDTNSALSATDGTGINVASNAGSSPVAFRGPVDLGTGSSRLSDGTALTFTGNSAGTSLTAADVDVFTSAQTAVSATGNGLLDIDVLSIDTASNGRALDLDGIQSLVDVDSAICSHTSNCVDLTSLAASSVTTFAGVGLTCTGGTCFNASAARTVEVTGTGNTISATNAVGLNLTNTTIGANDVTFESISASGAANGIVLNNTGSTGRFEVTGDGASSTSDTTSGRTTSAQGGGSLVLGSGGTIVNTTDGVLLTSATDVFLRNLVIGESTAAPGDAVSGTTVITDNGLELSSVNNLVLDNLLISQTGDHGIEGFGSNVGLTLIHTEILNAGDDGAGPTDGDDAMDFNTGSGAPLTGTVLIQSSILAGMSDTGLEVENFSGDLDLTVTDSFIGNNDHSDTSCNPCEGDGFLLRADGGSATIDMVVRNTTFNDIANDGIDLGNDQASNVSTLIAENVAGTNNDNADNLIDTANTNGNLRARITDLSSDSAHRGTVLFFKADGAATTDVTVTNSLIQGSDIGNGIEVFIDGDPGTGSLSDGNARVLVQNTQLSNISSSSITLNVQDMQTGSSTAGFLDATLENVTTSQPLRTDTIIGSVRGIADSGAGNGATLQLQIIDSIIGLGSFDSGLSFQSESLDFTGDSNIDIACVDDGNAGNGTPCDDIGSTTSNDGVVADVMNENGNQVEDGGARAFVGGDVFTSAGLRSGTGEVLIISPTEVTSPALP